MQNSKDSENRGPKVVVVGAGFAGVGAVRQLVKGGITDVTLVEAADRPGGRVQTIQLGNDFLELGAQYLHGRSVLYDFAKREGLLFEDEDDDEDDDEDEEEDVRDTMFLYHAYTFRRPYGGALEKSLVRHNLRVLEDLLERMDTADSEGSPGNSDVTLSAGEYLRQLYPQYTARMEGNDEVKAAFTKWLEDWSVLDSATTLNELSLPGSTRYEYEEGSGIQETRNGMWDVLQRMLKEAMPSCRLLVSKPVEKVCWKNDVNDGLTTTGIAHRSSQPTPSDGLQNKESGTNSETLDSSRSSPSSSRVTVHCQDGDILQADHVIVTAPIGFLREHEEFFEPSLPGRHREAIHTMGFGSVDKMFLLWDVEEEPDRHRFDAGEKDWQCQLLGEDVEGLVALWPERDPPVLKAAKCDRRTSDGREWYHWVSLMEFIPSCGHSLVVWIGGEGAVLMESVAEDEVREVLHEMLVLFLGNPDLPPPSRLVRSQWYNNPYTRGAYSYLATGVPLEIQDTLRQPLPSSQDPVLQLAGEACNTKFYSTAHGALLSGQQAANAVLDHHSMLH